MMRRNRGKYEQMEKGFSGDCRTGDGFDAGLCFKGGCSSRG